MSLSVAQCAPSADTILVEVWGPAACFTRPEFKVERLSYEVMTPSAARGILESIYWHPGMRYHIKKIHVLNPIRYASSLRNELSSKTSSSSAKSALLNGRPSAIYTNENRQQRHMTYLRDVRYVIEASITMTDQAAPGDNLVKFREILAKRVRRGSCYQQPCFGIREFAANFQEWKGDSDDIPSIRKTKDLGQMLYDKDYSDSSNVKPIFFRPEMVNGVVTIPDI